MALEPRSWQEELAHSMNRILYFSHDFKERRGGTDVLYDHVTVLRQNGFDAFIVHTAPNFRYQFGPTDVPVLYAGSRLDLDRDDVLVVPEDHRAAIRACRNTVCRKVLFCQNHHYIFQGLVPGEIWKDFGFSGYLCVSTPIQQAMRTWFGVEADIVRPGVDPVFFGDSSQRPEFPVTIAYMPRKGWDILDLVRGLFTACGFDKPTVMSWLEIDNMPREQVAAHLRKSHIYLSTGTYEGLGLPPIEAMGARCLVVGFAGGGGLDYALRENGVWVPDDDPWALATTLKQTVVGLNDPDTRPALLAKCEAGHGTALKYSRAQFERDLIRFWTAWR